MLALVVAGMVDWIVGVLFLTMEFLGEFVRAVFRRPEDRPLTTTRSRHPVIGHHRVSIRRRTRPRRRHPKKDEADAEKLEVVEPRRMKILVPISGDEPDLIDFAIEECRSRQAALIVLFLRPIGVMPMGPNPMPGLAEDDEAGATFDRIVAEADRLEIGLRTIYATTTDIPSTIGEYAREVEADVVLVGTTRRSGFARFLSRDLTPSILKMLPDHASLTIRAS